MERKMCRGKDRGGRDEKTGRQECCLSLLLFNICSEELMEEIFIDIQRIVIFSLKIFSYYASNRNCITLYKNQGNSLSFETETNFAFYECTSTSQFL